MNKNQENDTINVSDTLMTINEFLNRTVEINFQAGCKDLRVESLRNFKIIIGTPDEYSTGRYLFRRKNDKWYSIEKC